jgi:hypothetical protein
VEPLSVVCKFFELGMGKGVLDRKIILTVHRLGGVYQAGYFEMSTWIPFVWAVINTLVLILSSFAIYGGL